MSLRFRTLLLTSTALLTAPAPGLAGPEGPNVVGGSATVSGAGTPNVRVDQSSNRAIINWNTFNIRQGGFVLAARQHVSAVRMGYRTEELRQEREKLRTEYDQLKRSRDEVLTPERLTAEAEKIGLRSTNARQFEKPEPRAERPVAQIERKETPKSERTRRGNIKRT